MSRFCWKDESTALCLGMREDRDIPPPPVGWVEEMRDQPAPVEASLDCVAARFGRRGSGRCCGLSRTHKCGLHVFEGTDAEQIQAQRNVPRRQIAQQQPALPQFWRFRFQNITGVIEAAIRFTDVAKQRTKG